MRGLSPALGRPLAKIWRQRRGFARTRDWLARLYNGLLNRFRWLPLPGRGGTWRVRLRGFSDPFLVRQGSKDWSTLDGVLFKEEYGFIFDKLGSNPRQIVDLGANIGLTVRLWLEHYPQVSIVAVEPDPENIAMCRRNVEQTERRNSVVLEQCCIAATAGVRYLERGGDHTTYRAGTAPRRDAIAVRARTLDQILQALPGGVDLLKCDVEGAEAEIFQSPPPSLARIRFLAIELHGTYRLNDLTSDLDKAGLTNQVRFHRTTPSGYELALLQLAHDPDAQ